MLGWGRGKCHEQEPDVNCRKTSIYRQQNKSESARDYDQNITGVTHVIFTGDFSVYVQNGPGEWPLIFPMILWCPKGFLSCCTEII